MFKISFRLNMRKEILNLVNNYIHDFMIELQQGKDIEDQHCTTET